MPTISGNYADPQRARLHQARLVLSDEAIKGLPVEANWSSAVIVPAQGQDIAVMPLVGRLGANFMQPYGNLSASEPKIYGVSFDGDRFAMNRVPSDVFTLGGNRIVTLAPNSYLSGDSAIEADADSGTDVNTPLVFALFNDDNTALTGGDPENSLTIAVLYALFNRATGMFV